MVATGSHFFRAQGNVDDLDGIRAGLGVCALLDVTEGVVAVPIAAWHDLIRNDRYGATLIVELFRLRLVLIELVAHAWDKQPVKVYGTQQFADGAVEEILADGESEKPDLQRQQLVGGVAGREGFTPVWTIGFELEENLAAFVEVHQLRAVVGKEDGSVSRVGLIGALRGFVVTAEDDQGWKPARVFNCFVEEVFCDAAGDFGCCSELRKNDAVHICIASRIERAEYGCESAVRAVYAGHPEMMDGIEARQGLFDVVVEAYDCDLEGPMFER